MEIDKTKHFRIIIEKNGYNESVYGAKVYRLYINDELLESFNSFKELQDRLNKLMDGAFR
jgi:hypothetical protein